MKIWKKYIVKIGLIIIIILVSLNMSLASISSSASNADIVLQNDSFRKIEQTPHPAYSSYDYTKLKPKLGYDVYFKKDKLKLETGLAPGLAHKIKVKQQTTKERNYFLLQLYHDPGLEEIKLLKKLNITEIEYIPSSSFFVSMPFENIETLLNFPFVRSISPVSPAWKISPGLDTELKNNTDTKFEIRVLLFEDSPDISLKYHLTEYDSKKLIFSGSLTVSEINQLLNEDSVKWVEEQPVEQLKLSESVSLTGADDVWSDTGTPTGSGVKIGIIDSGLDIDHPHFSDVIRIDGTDWVDGGLPYDSSSCGHGTHVAGTIAGNSTYSGRLLKGVAPDATLIIERMFGTDCAIPSGLTYNALFDDVVDQGATIISNSWGHNSNRLYDSSAAFVDDYARDHPNVLIIFANGNYPSDTHMIAPALAKNVLAVGASVDGSTYSTTPTVNKNSAPNVDTISNLNNLNPPIDQRIKPDVVATGEYITSPIPWNSYGTWRGTSMATPHVSGIAALYKQLYPDASANEIKAAIIHGASTLDTKPGQTSYPMGWGKVNAWDALYWNSFESTQTHFNGTVGDTYPYASEQTFYVSVPSGAKKLLVTMTYMDQAGSTNVNPALVNDLDLSVVSPSSATYTLPNGGSGVDNVEKVIVSNPQSGTWTIKVKAYSIPGTFEVSQSYDGFYSIITEDPLLEANIPTSISTNISQDFSVPINPVVTGSLVHGVYVTVESLNSFVSQTGGESGYIVGDMYPGESESIAPTFTLSNCGTYSNAIKIVMGSSNAGTITRYISINCDAKTTTDTVLETHSCDSISVTALYSGDLDDDGSATLYYKENASSSWIDEGLMVRGDFQYFKTIPSLAENTNYDIKVDYLDPDGVIGIDPVYNYSINTGACPNHPPYVPGNPNPPDSATDQPIHLTVSWSGGDPDAGDSVTYDVYLDSSPNPTMKRCSSIVSTECSITALTYDQQYYWKVIATDNHGLTTPGPVWSFTTGPPPSYIPHIPVDLVHTMDNFWINYSWAPGSGNITDSYNISVNGNWENSTHNYVNTTVEPHGYVNVTVFAFNNSGNGALSAGFISDNVTIPNNPPNAPNDPSPINGDINLPISPTLSWTGSDPDMVDIITYDVYLDTDPNPSLKICSNISTTNCSTSGLDYDQQYYWMVIVTDNYAGSTSSSTWTFVTKPLSYVSLPLYAGWNLISSPLMPLDNGIDAVLSPIDGNYSIVWAYNASDTADQWKKFDPNAPFGNDLNNMVSGDGYWLLMTSDDALLISGTITESTEINVLNGWNLIGYNSMNPQPITDALSSINGNYSIVWAYNSSDIADQWKKFDPDAPFGNDLAVVEPGNGYWIMMISEDVLQI